MKTGGIILIDRLDGVMDRAAIISDKANTPNTAKAPEVDTVLFHDHLATTPRLGSIHHARISRLFPQHQRAMLDLGGVEASLRLAKHHRLETGSIITVTVSADAHQQKPPQLRRGMRREGCWVVLSDQHAELRFSATLRQQTRQQEETASPAVASRFAYLQDKQNQQRWLQAAEGFGLTLRSSLAGHVPAPHELEAEIAMLAGQLREIGDTLPAMGTPAAPGCCWPGPDIAEAARLLAPCHNIIEDSFGSHWREAGIDSVLDQATRSQVMLEKGACLHISTPPGAAVIDIDSAASGLPPLALGKSALASIARHLQLRGIGGPVVIDFPRLDRPARQQLDTALRQLLADDPARPQCHGFARGGLYLLERPWRHRPLAEIMADHARMGGVEAIRQVHRFASGISRGQRGLQLAMAEDVARWLANEGGTAWQAVCSKAGPGLRLDTDKALAEGMISCQDWQPR